MAEKIILFQGDSITDGNRLKGKENEWDLNHQMGHGYAYIINGILGNACLKEDLKFYNRGISGNRIADLYGRWKEDCINLKPDILSILIGINECYSSINSNSGSDTKRFAKIYRLLLDEVREKNPETKLVLCEPFALPSGPLAENFELWKSMLEPLQMQVCEIAKEYNAIFVPLQNKFNELCNVKPAEYWIWDGMHPTVCGHHVIAEEWLVHTKELFLK